MSRRDKLLKLKTLRARRQRLSEVALAQARTDLDARIAQEARATRTVHEVELRSKRVIKKALKSAEEIRDPSARFTDLALTLARTRRDESEAQETLEEASKAQRRALQKQKVASRANMRARNNVEKFDTICERMEREELLEEEVFEEGLVEDLQASRFGDADVRY